MKQVLENKQKFEAFREKYPEFVYKSYDYELSGNILRLKFSYQLSPLPEDLIESIIKIELPEKISEEQIKGNEDFIFRIGLIEAISYWKAYCSPTARIECGALSAFEISWWSDTWYDGLGEFRYMNGLLSVKKEDWVKFIFNEKENQKVEHDFSKLSGNLIAFTGGKDSTLALGLVHDNFPEQKNETFVVNQNENAQAIKEILGTAYPETIIKRKISDRLIEINSEGGLNGHTPFSIIVAFVGVFLANIRGRKYVIVANEASANEPTISGTLINHQYSKSLIAEKRFQKYCEHLWRGGSIYFSLLRPLSEAGIVSMLKKYESTLEYISSCNIKEKEGLWCCACPKCLFAFLMFSAIWNVEFATKLFGKNMFADVSNIETLKELTGVADIKPFDCVGTVDECLAALSVIYTSGSNSIEEPLLKVFFDGHRNILPDASSFSKICCEFNEHTMPEEFAEIIKKTGSEFCHA